MYVILNLLILLGLDSKHSYVLYSFLKDYVGIGRFDFSYAGLRHLFGIQDGQYASFSMFQKRVLEVAVQEINEKTDLLVQYEVKKIGRKIALIRFKMKLNKKGIDFLASSETVKEKLKTFGIQEKQIKQLLKKHDEQYILANIRAVEERINEVGNIKNVSAYLMSAFEQDYRPSENEYTNIQHQKKDLAEKEAAQEEQQKLKAAELKKQYLQERNEKLAYVVEGFTEGEYEDLRRQFEAKILQTPFHANLYKNKGFEHGAIQVEWRKFLIEKFLPSHLHNFENYVNGRLQGGNFTN